MKQKWIYLLLFLLSVFSLSAQLQIGKEIAIGTSLTYIPNSDTDISTLVNQHHEWTWNINITTSISQRFNLGLSSMFVYTSGDNVPNEKHRLFGSYLQFDAFENDANRFYAESGLFFGDYCTCGQFGDPYHRLGLTYVNYGGGYEWQFARRFNLEFAFLVYWILNDVPDKYGYTQYIIGLNYTIGK